MKCKYKKFLKAAYIDYEEDYCSNAVLRSSRPPLSEILAPATFEVTLSPGEGYYWTTFYTSMANYQAPEGVIVYKEHLEGRSITHSTVDDRIINKGQGVVLRSSTSSITLTKTYSKSSDDYSDNSLIGTDYLITNPGHAYGLSYKDSYGVAFYKLSSTGRIRANKAYLIVEDVYLTQWRMIGNSVVHTDEYLTQWKVSGNSQVQQYLTQWKVEGNSVVDNNTILSCGDLGQDNKYHVKISDGVDVFDIALTEPLRKVGNVADSIEFVNGVATLTRNFANVKWNDLSLIKEEISSSNYNRFYTNNLSNNIYLPSSSAERKKICLSSDFSQDNAPITANISVNSTDQCMCVYSNGTIYIRDTSVNSAAEFQAKYGTHEFLYRLATPTTEVIQAPQISVSPTYTSANDVAYSSFTYANPLIYSCGDYSDVDGKYHVKISNGVTIYDIPLTEPLRKVNDVADTIEFANGVATVTRVLASGDMGKYNYSPRTDLGTNIYWFGVSDKAFGQRNMLTAIYQISDKPSATLINDMEILGNANNNMNYICDMRYTNPTSLKEALNGIELIYELATPTTEVIQAPQIAVSPTDTYTSVNDTPHSAFEYKKNAEIWSCGEYSAVDGKYHILVQPLGGSIADIALDEPLRKVNDVADTIEFADGVAIVTRNFASHNLGDFTWVRKDTNTSGLYRYATPSNVELLPNCKVIDNLGIGLCPKYSVIVPSSTYTRNEGIGYYNANNLANGQIFIYDSNANTLSASDFRNYLQGVELIYQITPIIETIQVSQIEEAESYTCVISQGGKAVSWSSFETE